jgi:hypothetical protein
LACNANALASGQKDRKFSHLAVKKHAVFDRDGLEILNFQLARLLQNVRFIAAIESRMTT